MTHASDRGPPRVRVRRLADTTGWRRRARYEVELTEPRATEPAWTRQTTSPVTTIDRYLGVADAHAVVKAADRAWQGGMGPWESLYPGDRRPASRDRGWPIGAASSPVPIE